jgi:hypothetical protein
VFTSTIEQQNTKHKVKFNDYAQRIAKRFSPVNPNKPGKSFDTAPIRMPKSHIHLSYADALTTSSPHPTSYDNNVTPPSPPPNVDMIDMSLHIPTPTDGNSIRLADLESSLVSIQYERDSMQSDQKQLRSEFHKVLYGVIQHST